MFCDLISFGAADAPRRRLDNNDNATWAALAAKRGMAAKGRGDDAGTAAGDLPQVVPTHVNRLVRNPGDNLLRNIARFNDKIRLDDNTTRPEQVANACKNAL